MKFVSESVTITKINKFDIQNSNFEGVPLQPRGVRGADTIRSPSPSEVQYEMRAEVRRKPAVAGSRRAPEQRPGINYTVDRRLL